MQFCRYRKVVARWLRYSLKNSEREKPPPTTISLSQISNELNRPYATVYGQLHKALEQIGKCLEDEPIIQEWQSEHVLDPNWSDQNLVCRLLNGCKN